MTLVEIKDITRKDLPIYYRRVFLGTAVIELQDRLMESRVEFIIETQPTGFKEISVTLLDVIEFPLVSIISGIRDRVSLLDKDGRLP